MLRSKGACGLVFVALGASACSDERFFVPPADGGGLDGSADAATADAGDPDAGAPFIARDTFTRTVLTGLGEADIGGPWTLLGGPASYAVAGDHATITLPTAAAGRGANLGVVSNDVDLEVAVRLEKLPTGGGMYGNYYGRIVDDSNAYMGQVTVRADGGVDASLVRDQATDTILKTVTAPFLLAANEVLHVRLQVTGVSPTQFRLKVWRGTETQPSAWLLDVADSAPALQASGTVGLSFYLSGSATEFPYVVPFDDFIVRRASRP